MKKEYDKKLCETYPEIFKDRHADKSVTAMCWGFDVGDGWYWLIDALCSQLYADIRMAEYELASCSKIRSDPGAYSLHKKGYIEEREADAHRKIAVAKVSLPIAVQVKEKFGGLRFYVSYSEEADTELVNKHNQLIGIFEQLSYRVCENCGTMNRVSRRNKSGWVSTLCDTCVDCRNAATRQYE